MSFVDLLRRRWVVEIQTTGFPKAIASRHYTEQGADNRREALVGRTRRDGRHVRGLASMELALVTVRQLPPRLRSTPRRTRPIPGVFDPSASARHRASGRPA